MVYGSATATRNWLYDHGWRKKTAIGKPVISVGNLTVGGTGKTPIAMYVAEFLQSRGLKPAIVSRGYGGEILGVEKVDVENYQASSRYGDEPVLMATHLSNVPVIVGPDRVLAAQKAAEVADVIVADDAFQHRRLVRNLDIVVVDSTQKQWALRSLPWGMARESWTGIGRAGLIILSKTNLADADQVDRWRQQLKEMTSAPVVEAGYKPDGLVDMTGRPWQKSMDSWLAVSGIGQPKPFQRLLIDELKLNVERHYWYRDHHAFTEQDIADLANKLDPNMGIVITEKDAVKWRRSGHSVLDRVAIAKIKLSWPKGKEELDRALVAATS